VLQKEVHALLTTTEAGLEERRLAVLVLRVDVGPLDEEEREDLPEQLGLVGRVSHEVVQR